MEGMNEHSDTAACAFCNPGRGKKKYSHFLTVLKILFTSFASSASGFANGTNAPFNSPTSSPTSTIVSSSAAGEERRASSRSNASVTSPFVLSPFFSFLSFLEDDDLLTPSSDARFSFFSFLSFFSFFSFFSVMSLPILAELRSESKKGGFVCVGLLGMRDWAGCWELLRTVGCALAG